MKAKMTKKLICWATVLTCIHAPIHGAFAQPPPKSNLEDFVREQQDSGGRQQALQYLEVKEASLRALKVALTDIARQFRSDKSRYELTKSLHAAFGLTILATAPLMSLTIMSKPTTFRLLSYANTVALLGHATTNFNIWREGVVTPEQAQALREQLQGIDQILAAEQDLPAEVRSDLRSIKVHLQTYIELSKEGPGDRRGDALISAVQMVGMGLMQAFATASRFTKSPLAQEGIFMAGSIAHITGILNAGRNVIALAGVDDYPEIAKLFEDDAAMLDKAITNIATEKAKLQ